MCVCVCMTYMEVWAGVWGCLPLYTFVCSPGFELRLSGLCDKSIYPRGRLSTTCLKILCYNNLQIFFFLQNFLLLYSARKKNQVKFDRT